MSAPPDHDYPYAAFNFRIVWAGVTVAGASIITGIDLPTEAELETADSSGHLKYEPLVLEGVVTGDTDFLEWARSSAAEDPGNIEDRDTRQFVVEQYIGDDLRATHTLYTCWVSDYQALHDVDGDDGLAAIEVLRLEHGGVHVRPATGAEIPF